MGRTLTKGRKSNTFRAGNTHFKALFDYLKCFDLFKLFFNRTTFLDSKSDIFGSLLVGLRGLSQLDCLLSLSLVAKRDGFCRPIFHDEARHVVVREGRNIIVEQNSSTGSQYVANDVDFGNDGKAILLTGPNMGGKSCYLRQVNN